MKRSMSSVFIFTILLFISMGFISAEQYCTCRGTGLFGGGPYVVDANNCNSCQEATCDSLGDCSCDPSPVTVGTPCTNDCSGCVPGSDSYTSYDIKSVSGTCQLILGGPNTWCCDMEGNCGGSACQGSSNTEFCDNSAICQIGTWCTDLKCHYFDNSISSAGTETSQDYQLLAGGIPTSGGFAWQTIPSILNESEYGTNPCTDNYDNDCNGCSDAVDYACGGSERLGGGDVFCGDGIDNDCDELIDGADDDCNCGDNIIHLDEGEQCDGTNWGPWNLGDCNLFDSFTGGTLACTNCRLDTSGCTGGNSFGICGDGVINIGEQCDGAAPWGSFDTNSCDQFYAFAGGILGCYPPGHYYECTFDTSDCWLVSPTCDLTNAAWEFPGATIIEGAPVEMIVQGAGCSGESIVFEIYEQDPLFDDLVETIVGTYDRETWTSVWKYAGDDDVSATDPRTYKFKAIVAGTSEEEMSGDILIAEDTGSGLATVCGDYGIANCVDDPDNVAAASAGSGVTCSATNTCPATPWTNCTCAWDSGSSTCVSNTVYDDCGTGTKTCGDGEVQKPNDVGKHEQCDDPDFDDFTCDIQFPGVSGCSVSCDGSCDALFDINGQSCDNDGTQEDANGENCDINDFKPGLTCEDFGYSGDCEDFVLDDDSTTCTTSCQPDTSVCDCEYVGNKCSFQSVLLNDCNEDDNSPLGFKKYYLTATWTGNPAYRPEACVSGPKLVSCASQVQLGFFNVYTAIAAVVVIALVYFFLNKKKKK